MIDEVKGQLSIFDIFAPDTWYGRTSPEHCQAEIQKAKISGSFSKKQRGLLTRPPLFLDLRVDRSGLTQGAYWQMGGALLGAYMTHSFGESPNVAVASRLSQILEGNPHPKYSLSAKACQGILNRANKRGKELPKELKDALEAQANPTPTVGIRRAIKVEYASLKATGQERRTKETAIGSAKRATR